MSETIKFNDNGDIILLSLNNFNNGTDDIRVFLPSENINIFPCSRRGQASTEGSKLNYDPEARLNTERTNRLRTAINGFTDSFIDSFTVNKDEDGNELETSNLVFVLKGYRVEIKNFRLSDIADGLGIPDGAIYAHLSLHDNVSLGVADYYTEILYRQAGKPIEHNYIDVEYSDGTGKKSDFFMGVSFTKKSASDDYIGGNKLYSEDLPLFVKNSDGAWELVQTSKLPKIRHGDAEDSIKIDGDFTVEHHKQESFKVTKDRVILGLAEDLGSVLEVNGSATVKKSICVGDPLNADPTDTSVLITKDSIKTPRLNVTNYSADALATIDNANITGELKVQNNDGAAKIIADTVEVTTATIPVITGDTELTGKTTVSNDLAVAGIISTPTLIVDTISSKSGESLTVDSNVTLNGTMTVSGKTTLDDELVVNNKKATFSKGTSVAEGLTVTSGLTELKQTTTEGLTDNGDTKLKNLAVSGTASVTGSLEASSIKTSSAEATSLKVTGESKLGNVEAAEVTVEVLELKGIGQVPAVELAQLTDTMYQLRFKFGTNLIIKDERP